MNLNGSDLTGIDLSFTVLDQADLRGSTLTGVRSGPILGNPILPKVIRWATTT